MTANRTARGWVAGRVQGVNYRASFKREADRLAVTGWVRNLPDGRVEFLVSGTAVSIDALLDWAKVGPRFARVDDSYVECAAAPATGTFEIRF